FAHLQEVAPPGDSSRRAAGRGPASVHGRATSAHLSTLARWRSSAGLGGEWAPLYSRLLSGRERIARFHLRPSDGFFVFARDTPLNALHGLMWGSLGGLDTCMLCSDGRSVMDAWHLITECPALEVERREALAAAKESVSAPGSRFERLEAALREIALAPPTDL